MDRALGWSSLHIANTLPRDQAKENTEDSAA